jgi:methionyl-tRNA synthetase
MIAKNCGGVAPTPGAFTKDDDALLAAAKALLETTRAGMDRQAFHEVLESIWVVIRAANAYVDHQAPWALRKTDPDRMGTVLYVLAEVIRRVALLMQPFTPDSAGRMLEQVGQGPESRSFAALAPEVMLEPGLALPKPSGVFPRFAVEEEGGQ